jgi:hypothetical protein
MMRCLGFLTLAAAAVLTACKQESGRGGQAAARLDAAQLTSSDGEVALAEGGTLRFSVTSEQFRKWDEAQGGIDKSVQSRLGDILKPESPSERTIDAAVQYLEGHPSARAAIERAGLNVRQFVVMTVALEQEMRAASGRGSREREFDSAAVAVMPDTFGPPPVVLPYQPPPTTVYPPIDTSSRRVDTVYMPPRGDSIRSRESYSPWDSLVRRGTAITKRDSVNLIRDSIVGSIMKRDSIRRANLKRDSLARRTVRPPDTLWRDTTVKRDTVRRDTTARDTLRVDTNRVALHEVLQRH